MEENIIENIEELKPKKGFRSLAKKERVLIILSLVVLILLVMLLVAVQIKKGEKQAQQNQEIAPTPTPTVKQEEIIAPSKYATDSAVVSLEKQINTTKESLDKIDTSQSELSLPNLDMEVSLEN